MTFWIFLDLKKLTYLHSFGHIFFYKMNLKVRFVPLESRLQGLQFEHKFDLIWSPDGEYRAFWSWTKNTELADWIRPSGMGNPPERIGFSLSWQCWRGQLRLTQILNKLRTVCCTLQNPIFSLSQTHFSLFSSTIHLLLQFSFSISHFNIHLLKVLNPDLESPRQGALGRTDIFKLRQSWFLGLLQIQSSNQPSSKLYVEGRDPLTTLLLLKLNSIMSSYFWLIFE